MDFEAIQIIHAGGTITLTGRAAEFCIVLAARQRWLNSVTYGALEFHIDNGRRIVHQIEKDKLT